ncbi:MAG: hypothetical protein M3O25_04255 [Actinomycetota bacterium]|nr:hypothetical protein [Actinomycetota bacterium]
MREAGKGRRALGAGLLLLAMTVGAPALSSAQDTGAPPAAPPAPVSDPVTPPPPLQAPGPQWGTADPDVGEQDPVGSEPAEAAAAAPAGAPAAAPLQSRVAAGAKEKARSAASAIVSTGDNFYSPVSVTVFTGEGVTWRNDGQAQHSATAEDGSFDTGVFGPGKSRSQSFDSAGSFSYSCTVHGLSQSGTVTVRSASGGGGGGSGSSGPSEAAAVASPDAAGTSTSLPSTGFAALALAAVGLALLASGVAAGCAADEIESRGRRSRRPGLRSIFR